MKKTISILTIAIAVLFLGGCSYKIVKTDDSQTAQPSYQLETQQNQLLASPSEIVAQQQNTNSANSQSDLDSQTKCADSADKFLKKFLTLNDLKLATQTNHWNKAMGKCFVLVSGAEDSGWSTYYDLYDAVGQQEYAYLSFRQNDNNDYPTMCYLYPDGNNNPGNKKGESCATKTEFNKFVSNYMEN